MVPAPVTGRNVKLAVKGFQAFGTSSRAEGVVWTLGGGALCDHEGLAVKGF
jgi:hypothetical protein